MKYTVRNIKLAKWIWSADQMSTDKIINRKETIKLNARKCYKTQCVDVGNEPVKFCCIHWISSLLNPDTGKCFGSLSFNDGKIMAANDD